MNLKKKHQVFDIIPQRKHVTFPKLSNLLHVKPKNSVVEWLVTHTKKDTIIRLAHMLFVTISTCT